MSAIVSRNDLESRFTLEVTRRIEAIAANAQAGGLDVSALGGSSLERNPQIARELYGIADVVIDNRAPFGDATIELGGGIPVGAVSSITAADIAQLLTSGTARRLAAKGATPPLSISANIPGGGEHNSVLELRYNITRNV